MILGNLFRLFLNKSNIFYKIRFYVLIKVVKYFSLETEDFLNKKYKNIEVISKLKEKKFTVKPTGDKFANEFHKDLLGEHEVKGQFLVRLKNCFLLTQWSIPITREGWILIETSGKLGILVGNILRSNDFIFFPEIKFILYVLLIRISFIFKFNIFRNFFSYSSLFHMVPRHGFKPLEPAISHWVFENLPQLKMFFKAISEDENCKLFVGENLYDWQELTLNLMRLKKDQILKIKKKYLVQVRNLYLSRLPYVSSNDFIFQPKDRNWVSKTIRNTLEKKYNLKNTSRQKIAISRKFCGRRKLVEDFKVSELLKKEGYKIIFPEKLFEIDKILQCYQADTILGLPSGSAITNIIFSNKGKLVDILGKDKKSYISVWFLVSRELGMEYSLFLAKDVKINSDYRNNDFLIEEEDLNLLKSKL